MASARKLEQELNTMTETFFNLVRAAHITEERDESVKQDRKPPGEMAEVLAQKLVVSGQQVLTLIAELKRHAMLSDYAAMNQYMSVKLEEHEATAAAAEEKVHGLEVEMRTQKVSSSEDGREDIKDDDELRRLYLLAQEVPLNVGKSKQ